MPKILVTRNLPSKVLARLHELGTVQVHTGERGLEPEALSAGVRDVDALVCLLTDRIDASVIDGARQLRIIANVAVGYNNIDLERARAKGIVVTNTPDVLTESVAAMTWGMILAITRRMSEGERLVRAGGWKGWALDFMLGADVKGKQLGLVGLGRIGRAVAEKAPAFGMAVAYTDQVGVMLPGAEAMSLDRLLNTSDIVSVHVPLTPETRHLIDKRALAKMKRSAYLVNTARGPVVDEAALAWALEQRLIAGAALDVYENEPAVHPGLLTLDNVLLLPHLGSATTETRTAMAALAVENVAAVLSGGQPLTPVVS